MVFMEFLAMGAIAGVLIRADSETIAGQDLLPMTVQLNNVINTTTGERLYNVNMAATILTSLVPLSVYLISGRWFVRGIAAGAVKG